ncbi:MAG: tRNA (adenosine(37)-N6)-threonylcarbamoyltransferase complex ATPase subunit type 1 TsaE [Myxococcota bacterium]
MQSLRVHVANETQLGDLAARLAACLQPPCVLALYGQLGAGKTTFVRAFVDALAPQAHVQVNSPTYTLANTYCTYPVVHHLDLYRLDDLEHVWDLGLGELMLDEQAFVCVEWPKTFVREIAVPRLIEMQLDMKALDGSCKRHVKLTFSAECPRTWYDAVQKVVKQPYD